MITIEEFNRGASSVEKYLITRDDEKYLLRIYDGRFMDSRYKAFKNMKILYENDISIPYIYEYGKLKDNLHGYAIVEWIDGKPLDKLITSFDKVLLYGKEAALELLKMHSIEPTTEVDIYEKFLSSLAKKLRKVKELGVILDYDLINSYVLKYSDILKNKKTSIIHGDIHPGNMIINDNKLFFIDLDVCNNDFSWIDLTTNACNMDYPKFYTVLIDEYFNGNVPEEFWLIYNLYGVLYCLDNILYCNRMNNKSLKDGQDTFNQFLENSNYFTELKPKWFDEKILRKER